MSKHYKRSDDITINIMLVAVVFVTMLPIIPIAFILISIFYILNIKSKYVICVSSVITIIICCIDINIIISLFRTIYTNLLTSINNIIHHNLLGVFTVYKNFSAGNWLLLWVISMFLSGYFLRNIGKRKKAEQSGIKSLNASVADITEDTQAKYIKNGTFIGTNKSKKKIYLPDTAKHVFIAGTTGAGKTVLLSNFIKRAIEQNYGALIVDGKGDIGKDSILQITHDMCKTADKKLYVIDMNNPNTSSKYNPFINSNETIIKDMLINMSDWSEEHYKINAERYIQRLIKLLYLADEELSFNKIIHYINAENLQELSTNLVKASKIKKEEHLNNIDLIKSSSKIASDAAARFATIAESQVGQLFNKNGIDITTAIKEKALILFVLNPLLYPETSRIMGRLTLIDSKKAVSNLFGTEDRKFFIFDEINVYASKVLLDLINKSRSAGVTCFCASQSLADLESAVGESFKHQIMENCNNYFIMRQNSFKSAEECAKLIGTMEKMKMTYQLSDTEGTGKGSARKTREFIVHPDEIKSHKTGECVFVSRDSSINERIKVHKPF